MKRFGIIATSFEKKKRIYFNSDVFAAVAVIVGEAAYHAVIYKVILAFQFVSEILKFDH